MSAAISANQVKELREKTGSGMMECKKALTEANGDFDEALKILREKGLTKGEKRAGKTAAEGLVALAVSPDHTAAAVIELNCETDFVARNEQFIKLTSALAETALKVKADSAEALNDAELIGFGKASREAINDLLAIIGEKLVANRSAYIHADFVAGYIHPPGKIGVLIAVKAPGLTNKEAFGSVLRDVSMHIAAMSPRFLKESDVDDATLATEREIATTIAKNDGKPENIIPKIVEGKIKAFYKENCLVNQVYVKDNTKTISQVVAEAAKAAGASSSEIVRFVRYQVGETADKSAAEE